MTRKEVESLFKTHYTQMFHLALTLLFDEAESKDVVSEVFASLLSGKTMVRADSAQAFLLASVRHRCLNVLQHKKVQERFARLHTQINHITAQLSVDDMVKIHFYPVCQFVVKVVNVIFSDCRLQVGP